MEIRHSLSLDQHAPRYSVVAGGQGLDHDLRSESLQARGDAARLFKDVRDDGRAGSAFHRL